MSFLQTVYDGTPIFFQNWMTSYKGFLNSFNRFGAKYWEYRQFFSEFDTWPIEKKYEYQRKELIKLIRYANERSPFYRKLYSGIDINSIQTIEDLKQLPIVDKEILRQNISDVVTISHKNALIGHTGGTTGKSLVVYFTRDNVMNRMAMLDHFKSRVGFEHRKMKRASFNGKHIIPPGQKRNVFWRYNAANRQMIFSSFHLTEENMQYYVEELNRFKPDSLDGFFTSMCDLANYIARHNISLHFKPIAIFPTSETLTPTGRELLEKVFKAKTYDQYASSEGAPFITECPYRKLHIELASGVFEHIDSQNDSEILVTSFATYGTPLIRYRIGDRVTFGDMCKCDCGIESDVVTSIEGRKLDFLYNAEGAKINAGNIANLFKNVPCAIIHSQLIQDKINEVRILLEVDKNLYRPEYDKLLQNEFIHKFGQKTTLIIEHVDEIPRESSGKYQMIKNIIKNESLK